MKKLFNCIVVLIFTLGVVSCRKDSFITSPNASLSTSTDTLHFDTVFTTTGSVAHSFKIFNQNDQIIRLSKVRLMGGAASPFKINVDGTAGTSFDNIEIGPNDSAYVFVSVSINPSAANLPFVVRDSVLINYNGNDLFVQLEAFGQNANFLRNRRITANTTWNNTLPYVILGGVLIDENATLTIDKGAMVYFHADAPMIVNGSLKVNGEKYDSTRVVFRGDRLDPDYRDFPGSWPGIVFNTSSKDNVLNYAVIKNAYQGVIAQGPPPNTNPKVTLNECIIDNVFDAGVLSVNSSINARNCLITNCGTNVQIAGGTYNFTHCTIASYGNAFISHKNPVLFITNAATQTTVYPLTANFKNCIFYGEGGAVDNEIIIDNKGSTASVTFDNVIYKVKTDPSATFRNAIKNQPPLFDSIDVGRRYFDFRLKDGSPAVNKGINAGVPTDLDGRTRTGTPDIGCYEKQ